MQGTPAAAIARVLARPSKSLVAPAMSVGSPGAKPNRRRDTRLWAGDLAPQLAVDQDDAVEEAAFELCAQCGDGDGGGGAFMVGPFGVVESGVAARRAMEVVKPGWSCHQPCKRCAVVAPVLPRRIMAA